MFKMKYDIITDYIPVKRTVPRRRSGVKMRRVAFIVAHDSGNEGSTARNNVDFFKRTFGDESAVSAHTFIDNKQIIECIPLTTGTPEEAHHVLESKPKDNELYGGDSNRIGGGIELCFGGKVDNLEAYKRYVWYIAYCMYKFNLTLYHITGHFILDPKRKVDPVSAFKHMGKTWDGFLKDVEREYKECTGQLPSVPPIPQGWQVELGILAIEDLADHTFDGGKTFIDPVYWISRVRSGEMPWYEPVFMLRILKADKKEGGYKMENKPMDNLTHGKEAIKELAGYTYDGGKAFIDPTFWTKELEEGRFPWYAPVFMLRTLKADKRG